MGLWDDIELEKFKRCADTYLSCQGLKRLQAFYQINGCDIFFDVQAC